MSRVLGYLVAGSTLHVLSVLLEQDIRVLFAGTARSGDIVLFGFQPIDDFFGRLVIRLFASSVKVGQYLVKALNTNLRVIDEFQYAPTNCRRPRGSPVPSSMFFVLYQILFIL